MNDEAAIIAFLNTQIEQQEIRPYILVRPSIKCGNGLSMSIQANSFCYCSPRSDTGPWTHFEIGFPSKPVEELLPYIDMSGSNPIDAVYKQVPIDLIVRIIIANGGLA